MHSEANTLSLERYIHIQLHLHFFHLLVIHTKYVYVYISHKLI